MKGETNMKQYYRTITKDGKAIEIWHGDTARASWLLTTNKLVLPLGTHKPKNVLRETIKEF